MPFSEKEKRDLSQAEFSQFQHLIMKEAGLYFSSGRNHQLALGLDVRIAEIGLDSYQQYYQYLKFQQVSRSETARLEIQHLIDELTVQETHFFRNGPQFRVLKSDVLPKIVNKRKDKKRSIRIWSAGCSTGQEPYSIAMLVLESVPEPDSWDISILATDINHKALESARRGFFDKKPCNSLPREYLWKYLNKREGGYEVCDRIKEIVKFDFHNLVTESYDHAAMIALDIVFCRNVTIYFTLDTTRKVIERFYDKLTMPGFLFLGHSESLWKLSEKFVPVEFPGAFIYLKEKPGEITTPKPVDIEARSTRLPDGIAFSNIQWDPQKSEMTGHTSPAPQETQFAVALKATRQKKYEEALLFLKRIHDSDPDYTQAQVVQATILSNQGRDDEAIPLLEKVIERDSLFEEAYCLLGTLYKRSGDSGRASAMFNRVLYVNPLNPLASYHTAEMYLRAGDASRARKAYENTIKALGEYSAQDMIPMADDLTADFLSQVCQREIEIIDKA